MIVIAIVLRFAIVTEHKILWYGLVVYLIAVLLDAPKKQRHYEFHLWLWECNGLTLLCVHDLQCENKKQPHVETTTTEKKIIENERSYALKVLASTSKNN